MAKKTSSKPLPRSVVDPAAQNIIVPVGGLEAPVLYFDDVTNFGCNNGVVNATLVAAVHLPQTDGKIGVTFRVQCLLRTSIPGAVSMREAMKKAILLAMPPATQGAH